MEKLVNDFLNVLEYEKKYSINTINGYKKNLENFNNYLKSISINTYHDCTYDIVRGFIKDLFNKKYSNKSICRYISCLRSFFKYLLSENYIQFNPMTLITNPKLETRLPKFLYYEDVEKILKSPDLNNYIGYRDALVLEMLYSTGIRVSELVNIKLTDIKYSDKKIKVLGKGNKERYALYGSICEKLLNNYIDLFKNKLNENRDGYLFLSKTNKKINTREIRSIVEYYAKKSGINMKVSPHTFRHTYATHMLNDGADLRSVQELLGHENLSTTTIYTHLSNERLRNVYLSTHPRAYKED